MHGQERREIAARAERPGRASSAWPTRERGKLTVGDHLSAGHGAKCVCAGSVEPVRKDEWDVQEVVGLAREKRLQTSRKRLSDV